MNGQVKITESELSDLIVNADRAHPLPITYGADSVLLECFKPGGQPALNRVIEQRHMNRKSEAA